MTAIDTPIFQSIQQAIAIIRQGRELERLLLDAGFALPDAEHPASINGATSAPNEDDQPNTPEWPQTDPETGELIDARGIGWDSRIHSSNKARVSDGTWQVPIRRWSRVLGARRWSG